MLSSSTGRKRKRKQRPYHNPNAAHNGLRDYNQDDNSPDRDFEFGTANAVLELPGSNPGPDTWTRRISSASSFKIEAHEADLKYGPEARDAARSLEAGGSGLIKWGRSGVVPGKGKGKETISGSTLVDIDASFDGKDGSDDDEEKPEEVWVDRYDARLLLTSIPTPSGSKFNPNPTTNRHTSPSSDTGWTDLPSDAEDTFFFAPAEAEEYRREKRRREIERGREERLKAIRDRDGEDEEGEEMWGGSDEELWIWKADPTETALMQRTAKSIISSANPAQLEMRILANYGADKRFAFLRGRWAMVWRTAKEDAEREKQEGERAKGLGGLADYGSDQSSEDGGGADKKEALETGTEALCEDVDNENEAAVKEARRARAREWAEQRRRRAEANGLGGE